ncbi:MAG: hypothetical protein J6W93_04135 [Clostridia bacterium]|nr:hypothetical protein [Clostridia bacterium]
MQPDKLKKSRVAVIAAAALAALLLLLARSPSSGTAQSESGISYSSSEEYRAKLQSEVAELVEGVTRKSCSVVITFERGYEYIYAANQQSVQDTGGGSDLRREYVLAGGSAPVLVEERMPKVCGVAIVCRGITAAEEYKIIKLVSALFDLPTNRIGVTD